MCCAGFFFFFVPSFLGLLLFCFSRPFRCFVSRSLHLLSQVFEGVLSDENR